MSAHRARRGRIPTFGGCLLLVLVLAAAPLWSGGYLRSLMSFVLMWTAFALAWNIISGYTGYVSFGHTAFFGVAAYAAAIVSTEYGIHWALAILLSGVLAALLAVPMGGILLRIRGPFFALGMLGMAEVFRLLSSTLDPITGGGSGYYVTTGAGIWLVYYAFLGAAVVAALATYAIDRSTLGLHLRSIRDDEEAAAVAGVRTRRSKVGAFVLSALLAGWAGGAYAHYVSFLDPASAFNIEYSLLIILMTILGGSATLIGPILGAVVVGTVRELTLLRFPEFHLAAFGALMILTVLVWPEGIYPRLRSAVAARRSRARRQDGGRPDDDDAVAGVGALEVPTGRAGAPRGDSREPILAVRDLHKSFFGRPVIQGCSFEIEAGTITGLMGPNGSGKTTILNLVSGLIRPTSGSISFGAVELVGRRPEEVAALGIARTFQLPRIFRRLTALENVVLGNDTSHDRAMSILGSFGLTHLASARASDLSYGQRKLLELARVFAAAPVVAILDEPFAGVAPALRTKIGAAMKRLSEAGITLLIVGHEMEELFALCEDIIILDQGSVLCRGTPVEVQEDPRTMEAYFGRSLGSLRS